MTNKIRVIDLETTGLSAPEAAPCEVGAIDLIKSADGWTIDLNTKFDRLCNPSRKIPPEGSAVHHIVDSDVEGQPFWPEVLSACAGSEDVMFSPDVFCAHNAKFERQWFTNDFTRGKSWICTYKCSVRLWPDAPSHNNQALRYWLNPDGLDRHVAAVAHRAFPDAYVTAFLLREMLKEKSVDTLVEWSSNPILLPRIRFGMHAGKKFTELPASYLDWMSNQNFDEDVTFTVLSELHRRSA